MMASFPLPDLTDLTIAPFWAASARGELALPRRVADGAFDWYPGGADVEWVTVSVTGRLFSWATVFRPLHPGYAAITPYVSALVELDEAPGVRLVTRLLADPAVLSIGMPLRARFVDLAYPAEPVGVIGLLFEPA